LVYLCAHIVAADFILVPVQLVLVVIALAMDACKID